MAPRAATSAQVDGEFSQKAELEEELALGHLPQPVALFVHPTPGV
tara:strand:+ start:321 stop:455 length:135 start_codon:yes stop_codon:yes gene_type:complete